MKEKTWVFTDKAAWPDGPWKTEPDKIQWVDEKTDLDCLMVRGPMGNWCGYVGVPHNHKFYGAEYSGIDVDVHGGLTFAAKCQEDKEHGICHIPEQGRPDDVWWLGFDCGHFNDLSPKMMELKLYQVGGTYKDIAYVKKEVSDLAQQIR